MTDSRLGGSGFQAGLPVRFSGPWPGLGIGENRPGHLPPRPPRSRPEPQEQPLTDEDVIKLVQAGLASDAPQSRTRRA